MKKNNLKKNRKHDIKKSGSPKNQLPTVLSIIGLLIPEAIAYANIAGIPARSVFKKTNVKSRESEKSLFQKSRDFLSIYLKQQSQ